MKIKILATILVFFLILPGLALAICDAQDQTYRYKSAVFYVTNARRIRVTVYNTMGDLYPRCFTAWIKVDGVYKNLDGLPYSPSNWYQAWSSTAPNCFSSGYRVVSGSSASAEYDLTKYAPFGYTGVVEVRVSSDCYEVVQDPCFCWTAKVEVLEQVEEQYCYLDIYVKDNYNNPLEANIYVDGSYVAYSSHVLRKVVVGTHSVSASKEGYTSDTKTVSCSCSETKRVDLVLNKIRVCVPGEIRNRRCACSTQVYYEKCKADGSGWEVVIENCPPGYVCENGYCVVEKDGWYDTGRERCNLYGIECGTGTKEKEQEYRDYTCFGATCTYVVKERRWVVIGSCYQGCPSGYTCEAGICVAIQKCTPKFLDEYRCYGNWVQRKYLYSDCSTSWINWEYCSYGCLDGSCISGCEEGYLDNFRCSGDWVQREYRYSDCSTKWVNWKYCDYGCLNGACLPKPEEPCRISLSVTTPPDTFVGSNVETMVKITNHGDVGGYVDFEAYLCKTDPYCIAMRCDGVDPIVYIPGKSTRSLRCEAVAQKSGDYVVKVSYSGCDESSLVYSNVFSVKEKERRCVAKFLNEFKCSGNWKLQLYRYSDCSTSWVHVEYCDYGCSGGICLPKPKEPTTTTTTLPQKTTPVPSPTVPMLSDICIAIVMLLAFFLILFLILIFKNFKFNNRKKPEWFGTDC